jgi:hypothetical protein
VTSGRWVPKEGTPFRVVKIGELPKNDHWPEGGVLLRLGEDYPHEPWRGQTRAFRDGHFEPDDVQITGVPRS